MARRPAAAPVAVLFSALVAAALPACGKAAGRAQGPTSAPPTSRPVPASTLASPPATTAASPAVPAQYHWQRDQGMGLQLGGGPTSTLAAVVAPGPGQDWLVAGAQLTPAGTTEATVWTSPGALSWSETVLPAPAGPATSTAADAASYWGGRAVVVGSAGTGPTMRASVWLSAGTGRPFSPVPDQPALDPPAGSLSGAEMSTVAAGALGIFAAGTVAGRATLWYSTDGLHWSVLSGADAVVNQSPGAVVDDLLMTPIGVFAGGSSVAANRTSAALWYSSDGIHWSAVGSAGATFSGPGDRVITSLVDIGESGNPSPGSPGPTGLLAVGGVRAGASWQPASWISPNGLSWSEASNSFPLDAEPPASTGAVVYAATGADGRLLAVGGSNLHQRLWQSPNGQAWSEIPLPPAAATDRHWHLGLVASNGGTTVVADNLPGQPYLLALKRGVWYQPSASGTFGSPLATALPTSLVADNGTLVMSVLMTDPGQRLGTGTTSVAVLTSSDGRTWQTANVDAFDQARVNQLLLVPGGILAVGARTVRSQARGAPDRVAGHRLEGPVPTGAHPATGAFASLSTDLGTTWPRTPISPTGLGGQGTTAVAAGRVGQAVYVAGQAGAQAVYWYSPDGTAWQPPRPLDQQPQLGLEQPLASCSGTGTAVVVGSVAGTARGSLPAAWWSSNGDSWASATLGPAPPAGSSSSMDGCLFTGNSFLAYGGSTGNGPAMRPALWTSTDGSAWEQQTSATFRPFSPPGGSTGAGGPASTAASTTRQSTTSTPPTTTARVPGVSPGPAAPAPGGLGGSTPGPFGPFGIEGAPLDGLAYGGTTWLAVSGRGDLPWQRWPAPVGGAAGALPVPVGLWASDDAGATWQQLDPLDPAFTGFLYTQATVATFVGQEAVVAGTLDGQLAVWAGTLAPASPTS